MVVRSSVADGRVMARFMKLMEGASVADWTWLLRMQTLREKLNVYYDLHTYPLDDTVEWPIVWALARFNNSFISSSNIWPKLSWADSELNQFSRRMHWRWHFRNSLADKPSICIKSTSGNLPSVTAPEVGVWLSSLRQAVVGGIGSAVNQAKHCMVRLSNELGITRLGWRMIRWRHSS